MADSFRNIPVVYDNVLVFGVSRKLRGTDKDLIILCANLPPMGNPAYILRDHNTGIDMLERCMLDIFETETDAYVTITGDFNARGSSENAIHFQSEGGDTAEVSFMRLWDDKVTNAFGTMFLDFCCACYCSILNGLVDFDCDGSYTFITQNSSNVVDYFGLSND